MLQAVRQAVVQAMPRPDAPDDAQIAQLEDILGLKIGRRDRLRAALTHSSLAGQRHHQGASYERLEFLGDRVLGLVLAQMLMRAWPGEEEGGLARRLAELASGPVCGAVAIEAGLDRFILAAPSDLEAARANPSILGDVCEAVLAVLYLEGGLEAARHFIEAHWSERVKAMTSAPREPKTALQEWAQARGLDLPVYEVTDRSGPDHAPEFTVTVTLEGLPPASAKAASRRAAEKAAADALLNRLAG